MKYSSIKKTISETVGKITGTNDAPLFVTEPTALTPAPSANADSSVMTVKALDPDGFPIEYGVTYFDSAAKAVYSNDSASLPPALASPTIIRDSSDGSAEFKFISRTSDSDGSGNATDNELKVRYQATDGIRTGVTVNTFKNSFGYNLWRYYVPSGYSWGTSYFHMDTSNSSKIGWYSSTSRSSSTDILRGNTSLTSTALTYKSSGVAAQGTYGFWRGGAGRDFFSDNTGGFSITNNGDFFKSNGTFYLYATTGTSGTSNLVADRDMLYFWFADPLAASDLVGSVVAWETYSNDRSPNRLLVQYYAGSLTATYDAANWVTMCTLTGNAHENRYHGPLAIGGSHASVSQ